jgi:hypothetical protein
MAGGQKSIASSESYDVQRSQLAALLMPAGMKTRRLPAPSRVQQNSLLQGISQGI